MKFDKQNITPLVSVIMPCYNSQEFVGSAIESVLSQEYKNWELLIIDDASKDETWQILNDYSIKDKRIKIFRLEKWSGPAIARNKLIEQAKGRFIAFLDSDDIWKRNKLKIQIPFMIENKVALSYSWFEKIDEEGNKMNKIEKRKTTTSYNKLLCNNVIGCLTGVYDQSITGKQFMPLLLRRQDYGLWLQILRKGFKAKGIPEVLAEYRVRRNSISGNKWNVIKYQWELYYKIEKQKILKSILLFSNWAIRGVIRKYFS